MNANMFWRDRKPCAGVTETISQLLVSAGFTGSHAARAPHYVKGLPVNPHAADI